MLSIKNDFVKSVAVLMTGTVIAQAVGYLISPILTRIYSPQEMGELGIYMRLVSFIAALATARYEMTLPLPKKDEHSFLLFRLSLRISFLVCILSFLVGVMYLFFSNFDLTRLVLVIITVLSAFFVSMTNLGTNWAIRLKQFSKISRSRITNSIVSNGLRWGFGAIGWGSFGLLLSSLIGYVSSNFWFIQEYTQKRRKFKGEYSKSKTLVLASEYKEFPMVSLPHVLIDLGRDLLIAFLIAFYYGKESFGSYSYAMMILSIPIALLGQAIGQVFFNKCSELINDNKSVLPLVLTSIKYLFAFSIIPFVLLFFFGEGIFAFVFGQNWKMAGHFSEILTIWIFFNFLISPLSNLPYVLNRQKSFFWLGLFNTTLQLLVAGILPIFIGTKKDDFIQLLWVLSITQAMAMIISIIKLLSYARKGKRIA